MGRSQWSSCERGVWPWIYENESFWPSLIISTLEAVAVFVGLKVFCGETLGTDSDEDAGDAHVDRQPRQRFST